MPVTGIAMESYGGGNGDEFPNGVPYFFAVDCAKYVVMVADE